MKAQPDKILAIQFKFFGDAVVMTPALRAIRKHFPGGELHLLVPEEIAPLFHHLPWLNRVWSMPRRRGSANPGRTWPVIHALRREHFDRSVDFGGNDRGAIASLLIGARRRLGPVTKGGFLGRRFCYNQRVSPAPTRLHESVRLIRILSSWQIEPSSLVAEICPDPTLDKAAEKILPMGAIVCHIATSQPKKEWPLAFWADFYRLASAAGQRVIFTTAKGEREAALTAKLKELAPDAQVLDVIRELPLFLAVLKRARIFLSGDTGPLHFAAGLGVPTISLFGPSRAENWAPVGERHQVLAGDPCGCDGNSAVCLSSSHCLSAISPERVFAALQSALKLSQPALAR